MVAANATADAPAVTGEPGRAAPGATNQRLLSLTLMLLTAASISVLAPSNWLNAVAVGLFLAIVRTSYISSRAFLMLMLPILFLKLSELLPSLLLEATNSYMGVSAQEASLTGATARLSLFDAIFWLSALIAFRPFEPAIVEVIRARAVLVPRWVSAAIIALGSAMLVYFVAIGLTKGFPLITGAERFAFRRDLGGTFDSLLNNRSLIVPMLAIVQVVGYYRRYAQSCAVLLILVCVLLGEKFTSVGLLTCQYAAICLTFSASRRLPVRLFALTLVLLTLTLPAVLISLGALEDPQKALLAFSDRLALQAQLWFLADREMIEMGTRFDFAAVSAEAIALLNPAARQGDAGFGLYYVMWAFADVSVYDYYLRDKIGFIFALLPYWLYAYGPICAGLLTMLAGVSLSVLTGSLFVALRAQLAVFVVLLVKGLSWNLNGHIVGYSFLVFGIEPVLIVAALVVALSVPGSYRHRVRTGVVDPRFSRSPEVSAPSSPATRTLRRSAQ